MPGSITFVIFVAYALFVTLMRFPSLAHLLFTPDLTIAILYTVVFPKCSETVFNTSRMLFLVLFLQLPGHPILYIFKSLYWLNVQERTTYKLIRSSPRYLRDLITLQPSRSTRSSTLVTLLQLSVDSSFKITDRSFRYTVGRTSLVEQASSYEFLVSLVQGCPTGRPRSASGPEPF